jgi:RNA polymerase sigma-70 factor, ECF subfamily
MGIRAGNVVKLTSALTGGRRAVRGGTLASQGVRPSETLGQAYIRCHHDIRDFLYRRTGNAAVADELVQEIWLRIAPEADDGSFDNPDSWLQKIAVNITLNWLKSHRFRESHIDAIPDGFDMMDDAPEQDRQVQSRQSLEYLESLLDELPPRRRLAFLLYRGEGLTLQETAHRMGTSVATVKVQTAKALAFLRKRMGEAGLWP